MVVWIGLCNNYVRSPFIMVVGLQSGIMRLVFGMGLSRIGWGRGLIRALHLGTRNFQSKMLD